MTPSRLFRIANERSTDRGDGDRALARLLKTGALVALISAMAGCSAFEVTARRSVQASTAGLKGTGYVLKATGNASVTPPNVPRLAEATAFFESQRRLLARQAAAGGGEDIDALAALLGRPDGDAVARWMQAHYSDLFSDWSVGASKVIARIDAQVG